MDPAHAIPAVPAKVTIWNRNFICALAANLCLVIAHFSVNPLVATYATFLGAAPVVMGLLTGMFFAISFVMRPVSGPAMTKIDKRKLMIAVYALGAIVNVGYAMFHSIPLFIVFRFLHGVQYSFVGSLNMTVAGDSLPREKLASGMGIYGAAGAIGTAFGPSIGITLLNWGTAVRNQDFGFTCDFLFAAVMFLVALVPSLLMQPDRKTKEDVASTGAWYKNIASLHAVPTTVVMFFIFIGFSLYNTYVVNLAAEQGIPNISLFYTVMAVSLIIFRPLSGWLTDRLGVAKIILPGLIIFAASFIIIGLSKSLGSILVGAAVGAMGVGSTQPAIQAMCMQSETPLRRSVASNTIYIGMDLALFFGPLFGSIIYQHSSYAVMFRLTVIPVLLAAVFFILILPTYNKRLRSLEQDTLR